MKPKEIFISFTLGDLVTTILIAVISILSTSYLSLSYATGVVTVSILVIYLLKYIKAKRSEIHSMKEKMYEAFKRYEDFIKLPEGDNFPKLKELVEKEHNNISWKLEGDKETREILLYIYNRLLGKLRRETPSIEISKWYFDNLHYLFYYLHKNYILVTHDILSKETISKKIENGFNDMLKEHDRIASEIQKIKEEVEKLSKDRFTKVYFTLEKVREMHKGRNE